MALQPYSRRRFLAASLPTVVGAAGCVSETPGTATDSDSEPEQSPDPTPDSPTAAGDVRVVDSSVADFVLYPLSGTHPHVYRRAGMQYVVARIATEMEWGAVSDRLALELDGESASLAERQPVSWDHDDVVVAFAVAKARTIERGTVRFDGETLRTLSAETVTRLNNPPVFDVSNPTVSPTGVEAGETVSGTVTFTLSNEGDGPGTFGASLKGNYVSGANTVTATLEAGAKREVSASVKLYGEGDEARVRLDWGADEWVTGVPVVGTETS